MFGLRKLGKVVFFSLLAASAAVWAPAWQSGAGAASPGKVASPSDIVATAGPKIVITRGQMELAMARYKASQSKDKLTDAEVTGVLEDLIRRRLLLQTTAVNAYRKDPSIVAQVKDYEDTLIVARWAEDKIRSKVQVPEKEIRAYYDKNRQQYRTPPAVKASYILLRTRDEADMVFKKLHEGADFAQLAKQYSIDLPTGRRGGVIGKISESKKPSELGKVLFLLAKGETSDIITTKAGFAIFKADEIYPPGFKSYEIVHNDISDKLFREKARDSFKEIVQDLERKGGIKIFSQRLAALEQAADKASGASDRPKTMAAVVDKQGTE